MILSNLLDDPFFNQLVIGITSCPKFGKTTFVTDLALAKKKQFVFLFSVDKGTGRIRLDPRAYQGKLSIVYIWPTPQEQVEDAKRGIPFSFTKYFLRRLHQVVCERVPALVTKGVPYSRIWICLDTVTAMQNKFLHEGHIAMVDAAVEIGGGERQTPEEREKARVYGMLSQQPEWGANLATMVQVTDYLMERFPGNIIYSFLSRQSKDWKSQHAEPAVQGASYAKIVGDLDLHLYMDIGADGKRVVHTKPNVAWEAGDRFGILPPDIAFERAPMDCSGVPTLLAIRNLIYASGYRPPAKEETAPEAPAQEPQAQAAVQEN